LLEFGTEQMMSCATTLQSVSKTSSPVSFQSGHSSSSQFAGHHHSSPMKIELVNPIQNPDWDGLVQTHPDASFFHTAVWARVLHRTYGHQPFYLHGTLNGITQMLVPLMEVRSCVTGRRGISLPFTDDCPPLFFTETASCELKETLMNLAGKHQWSH